MDGIEQIYPCVGICMPDEDEAYCLGCGRPWSEPRPEPPAPLPKVPESTPETPPA